MTIHLPYLGVFLIVLGTGFLIPKRRA